MRPQVASWWNGRHNGLKAISDPRYEVDTAYRNDIEQKIKRSNVM